MANDDVRRLLILTFEKTRFLCGFPVRVAGRCGGGDVTALSCFIFDPMCHPLLPQNPASPHTPQKRPTAASGCRAGVFVCLPPSPATQGEPGGYQGGTHIFLPKAQKNCTDRWYSLNRYIFCFVGEDTCQHPQGTPLFCKSSSSTGSFLRIASCTLLVHHPKINWSPSSFPHITFSLHFYPGSKSNTPYRRAHVLLPADPARSTYCLHPDILLPRGYRSRSIRQHLADP